MLNKRVSYPHYNKRADACRSATGVAQCGRALVGWPVFAVECATSLAKARQHKLSWHHDVRTRTWLSHFLPQHQAQPYLVHPLQAVGKYLDEVAPRWSIPRTVRESSSKSAPKTAHRVHNVELTPPGLPVSICVAQLSRLSVEKAINFARCPL